MSDLIEIPCLGCLRGVQIDMAATDSEVRKVIREHDAAVHRPVSNPYGYQAGFKEGHAAGFAAGLATAGSAR